jgi:hypothetical protein
MNLSGHSLGLLVGRGIIPTQGFYIHRTTEHRKTRTTVMPRTGFEPAISVFERSKTVLALDRAAIGTGSRQVFRLKFFMRFSSLCVANYPAHLIRFDLMTVVHIWWRIQMMKLLIVHLSPFTCYFDARKSIYSPLCSDRPSSNFLP